MKNSQICFGVAILLFSHPRFALSETASAFGFTFGEKIEASQCSGSAQFPSHPKDGYCLVYGKTGGYQGNLEYTGLVSARFKYGDLPFWTGAKLSLYLIGGKIEGIISSTGGLTTNLSVTDELITKYGQPTEKLTATAQNGFGGSFDGSILIWDLNNIKVKYFPIYGSTKEGRIDIFSIIRFE